MEKMPAENLNLESIVDHEGMDTAALADRLANPKIKEQVLDILEGIEVRKNGKILHEVLKDESGNPLKDGANFRTRKYAYIAKTRKEIEADLDMKTEQIRTRTNISFGEQQPGITDEGEILPLNWKLPTTGEKPTPRMWSIVEAHEKGHFIRQYGGDNDILKRFENAFDLNLAESLFTREYCQNNLTKNIPDSEEGFNEKKAGYLMYFFSAQELAERMSQLKNYFSMHGDEEFTARHLEFARRKYVKDTGMDNGLDLFFKCITPEKEKDFLELINSAGI